MSSGNLSLLPSDYSVSINYSFSGIASGRNGLVEIIDVATHGAVKTQRWFLGSGTKSGNIVATGLQVNTQYRVGLHDYKNQSDYTNLAFAYATTLSQLPPPPLITSGTLSAVATSPTAVSLNYSYQNGSSVSLFRDSDLVITFGSGSSSGVYIDTVEPDTIYNYTLRNGATIGSTLLASATVGTPPLPTRGTLSCNVVDSSNIDLVYTFADGINVSLFNGSEKIKTLGSGVGSGTYRCGSLSSNTSYAFYLRNGTTVESILLATVTGKTLQEVRKAIVERGRILPLSSKLTIFDNTLTPLGIIEDYEYLEWIFRFRRFGEFTLIINRYKPNVQYLAKGNIVALYVAGYYRAARIESIKIVLDEEGKITEDLEIIGRDFGGLFVNRLALHSVSGGNGYYSLNAPAETIMKNNVNFNCMDADDTDRNCPLLFLEPDMERGGTVKSDTRFQYLAEVLEDMSLASGLGWEIILDPSNKKLIFQIIEGLDRSFDNGVNSPVTFSPAFGNIRLMAYLDSNINSKNVAYVAGQGEAENRLIVKVTKNDEIYTSFDRREFFVDARDANEEAKLIQRGNERLAEYGEETVFEMENLSSGIFKYGQDFYLGDIVTAGYTDIASANMRIIESKIEITPDELIQNRLTLGKQFPDLLALSEYKNKNFYPETRR